MGTVGVDICFLQEKDIRILATDFRKYSFHIAQDPVFVRSVYAFTAVHKEVRIIPQGAVANVPSHNAERFSGGKGLCRFTFRHQALPVGGLILRRGQ